MYGTAVNLGAGGFDDVMYFEEGGSPMYLDDTLRSTAPGAQSPRPQFGRLRAPVGDTSILQGDGDLRYYDDPDFNPELDLRKSPTGEAFGEDAIQLLEEKGLGSLIMDKIRGESVTDGIREPSPELIEEYEYSSVFDEGARVPEPAEGRLPVVQLRQQKEGSEEPENFDNFMNRFLPPSLSGPGDLLSGREALRDQRHNAIGQQIFKRAGMAATVEELTKMVDENIFKQLDRILGRTEEDRMTPAP